MGKKNQIQIQQKIKGLEFGEKPAEYTDTTIEKTYQNSSTISALTKLIFWGKKLVNNGNERTLYGFWPHPKQASTLTREY